MDGTPSFLAHLLTYRARIDEATVALRDFGPTRIGIVEHGLSREVECREVARTGGRRERDGSR